jgi:triacylglycerol lipase
VDPSTIAACSILRGPLGWGESVGVLDAPLGGRRRVRAIAVVGALALACGGDDGFVPSEDAGVRVDSAVADGFVATDAGMALEEDAAVAADQFTPLGPPYPIVLAHGFFGFEELGGSFLTYFYGVKDDLAAAGETNVHTPAVDPFNDSETRGEELAAAIDAILAETGHEKVVIVGHSQGGLDARYVASTRPERVAAVVTIATPHFGTPTIDLVRAATDNEDLREWVDELIRIVGRPLWDAAGEETSFFAALDQLSEEGAAAFNEAHPDRDGVDYFSIGGRSDRNLAFSQCQADDPPAFIADFALERDPIDPLLSVSEAFMDGGFGDPEPNDGLVRVSSSRWGTFLGCVPADHFDQMGQILGDDPGLGNEWEHLPFYRDLVGWLRARGY